MSGQPFKERVTDLKYDGAGDPVDVLNFKKLGIEMARSTRMLPKGFVTKSLHLVALGATLWGIWSIAYGGYGQEVLNLETLCHANGTADCGHAPAYWAQFMATLNGFLVMSLAFTVATFLIAMHRHVLKDGNGDTRFGTWSVAFIAIAMAALLLSWTANYLAYDQQVGLTPDEPTASINDGIDPSLNTTPPLVNCPFGDSVVYSSDGSIACHGNGAQGPHQYDYGLPNNYDSHMVESEIYGVMVEEAECPSGYAFYGNDQTERCIAPMK